MIIKELFSAFILGVVGGIIPGPVLAATFTEVLQSGFVKSMRIVLLAMASETLVATICLVALASLNLPEFVFRILSLIGAIILIWISMSIWKINKLNTKQRVHFSFGKISAMILANGMLWTFWITVCVPKAISLSSEIRYGGFIFLAAVELGWLFSTSLVAFAFSRFRKLLSNPKVIPIMFKIFALAFIYFAVSSAYQSIMFIIKIK
jgi:threonine/homoserine/homoserine lactone efflux protein